MPLLIVEILLQIALATHAVRSGRSQPWLWIILMMPGLGCILYVAIEIIPEFLRGPAGNQAARDVRKVIAPDRDYRRLLDLVEMAPTVANKTALAEECLRTNRPTEAVALYESCLTGLHEHDPSLLRWLAEAQFDAGQHDATVATLDRLRAHNPDYQSADAHLLYARALEEGGREAEALRQYAALVDYFPGEEARCRYAMLLQKSGQLDPALALFADIVRNVERQGGAYRRVQRPWYETARRMRKG